MSNFEISDAIRLLMAALAVIAAIFTADKAARGYLYPNKKKPFKPSKTRLEKLLEEEGKKK